jgi:hypothetical protein
MVMRMRRKKVRSLIEMTRRHIMGHPNRKVITMVAGLKIIAMIRIQTVKFLKAASEIQIKKDDDANHIVKH